MKWFKKILISMIILMNISNCFAKECEVVTYYSKKNWITYYDMFDKEFSDSTFIANSNEIPINLNGFGPYSFSQVGHGIFPISSDNLNGKRPLVVKGEAEHQDFYSTLVITFGARVKLYDIDLALDIRDKNNNLINYLVYILTDKGIKQVYEGESNSPQRFNLNGQEVKELYVRAKKPDKENVHTLKYFKINKYEAYTHETWTQDYIPNTETMTREYCKASGDYFPNGTEKYEKNFKTLFVPSKEEVNNSISKFHHSKWMRYNDGLGIGVKKGSKPDYDLMYLWNGGDRYLYKTYGWLPKDHKFEWRQSGDVFRAYDVNNNTPYIKTQKSFNRRHVYVEITASMVHCIDGNCDWNKGKRHGHTNIEAENAYDVTVKSFYRDPLDGYDNIVKLEIDLCNTIGVDCKRTKEIIVEKGKNLEDYATEIELNETGAYKLYTKMYNQLGDSDWIISKNFFIDNELPYVSFNPAIDTSIKQKSFDVEVIVSDDWSLVDKWRYAISKDGGKTFSTYGDWIYNPTSLIHGDKDFLKHYKDFKNVVTLNEPGDIVLKVNVVDKANNINEAISPIYKLKQSPPVLDLKENIYFVDEVVTKEDLKKNAIAKDEIDGDISNKVIIEKIEYEDGRIDNFPDKLDTSKKQIIKITYSVTNSNNDKVSKAKDYQIIDKGASLIELDDEDKIYNRYIELNTLKTLKDNSIWLKNERYKNILEDSLAKTKGFRYEVN